LPHGSRWRGRRPRIVLSATTTRRIVRSFHEKAFVAPSKSGDRAGESSSDVVRLPHGALHLDMCIVYYTRSPLDGNPREAREDAASRANVFRAGGIAASGYGDETLFVAALRLKNCRRHE
jgi:hypothetical protein